MNTLYGLAIVALTIGAVGGIAYYLIAIIYARRLGKSWKELNSAARHPSPPISLLKPLCGAEPELEQCLESFFVQQYPVYEILFAVRTEDDPAVAVVNRLRSRYPRIPVSMILTGEPPYANAKVYSLERMALVTNHELLVITDSDTSVAPDYLRAMAREFASPRVGAVTNLYRGVGGGDLWSRLEALGMSTELMAGVVVAGGMEGMKFTLGPSMAIREKALRDIGGFGAMKDYLADDFVLGNWAAAAGWRVELSTHVVNHHASNEGFARTFFHRLRWNRSARFSRPAGYVGQGFTYGSGWAILLFLVSPAPWSFAILCLALTLRVVLAWQVGGLLLSDSFVRRRLWLVPLQDLLSLASWIGGFTGREILWRNERYRLLNGGRFELMTERG